MLGPQEGLKSKDKIHTCPKNRVCVTRLDGQYGILAVEDLQEGEVLFRIEGKRTNRPSPFSIQIEDGVHIDLEEGHNLEEIIDRFCWRFMNHSCSPNTIIRCQDVVGIRLIRPGEELTFNYNTTEWDMAEPFTCRCGSPICVGQVRGFKHLSAIEKERLRPFLAPHLARHLERESVARVPAPAR
jgi:hypothetical protein